MPLASLRFLKLYISAGSPKLAVRLLDEGENLSPLWPPSTPESKKLLKRRFDFSGSSIEIPGRIIWQSDQASDGWYRDFYSFRWLRDIAISHTNKIASSLGREFVYGFTQNAQALPAAAFDADVIGMRVASWLTHRYFLLKGGSLKFRKCFLRKIISEIRHLYRLKRHNEGLSCYALQGLVAGACVFHELHFLIPSIINMLEQTLKQTVLPDGMHISRNASEQLRLLVVLLEIRQSLAEVEVTSDVLQNMIQRMASMLLMLRHGDNRLALFNGNLMEDAAIIARVAQLAGVSEPAFALGVHSGFFRLEGGEVTLLFAGRPTRTDPDDAEYINSFEFSDRIERVVVNCGYFLGVHPQWRHATRQASAHSSASIEVKKQEISLQNTMLIPPPLPENDKKAGLSLMENLLEKRDGHAHAVSEQYIQCSLGGIVHQRSLTLKNDGSEIRGRDILTPEQGFDRPRDAKIYLRFHLHPDIRCQHPDNKHVVLTSVKGSTWKFTIEGYHTVSVEESVYLGYYGKPQKTQQLVVTPAFALPQTEICWNFARTDHQGQGLGIS
ncbi:MAG: heparinase II/III family protein [Rickettsiales bacterium]